MLVKEQLIEARELIQQKRYGEARRMLKTIQHPKAREWLQQLDRITDRRDIEAELDEAKRLIKALRYNEARSLLYAIDHPAAGQMLLAIDDIQQEKRKRGQKRNYVISVALLAFLIISASVFLISQSVAKQNTYDDGVIRVRYQFPWLDQTKSYCDEESCKLMLQNFFSNKSGIAVMYEDVGVYVTNDDLHHYVYEHYASDRDVETDSIMTYDWEYKGAPAVLVTYNINFIGRFYNTEIWFSEGNKIFGIIMFSGSKFEYEAFKPEFDKVIESFEFLPQA